MSWESEHARDPGWPAASRPAPGLAPLLTGFVVGLVAMTATPFVYYWLFAPAYAALVGAAVAVVSIKFTRLRPVAEGVFAAVLFGVIFVLVAFAGLSALA